MDDLANPITAGTTLTTADEMPRLREHGYCLKTGITRTPEFERKRLACFAVNVGLKCGQEAADTAVRRQGMSRDEME